MHIDYDKIREENIREYGEGTRHLSFLSRLYTDRTHFVFELLQNAEDAGATRILFSLFGDRLEVAHDGRPFNELDVRGVCGVGEGTKAEDLTQIGKFGIGFKSVYAYTETPEVHSGGEGFRIDNYVRPHVVRPRLPGNSWTTLFVFSFDTGKITPETACKEIGARLRNLNARTLLFLRKITEIEYRLPDSTSGIYLREETARGPGRQVSVTGQNAGKDEEESWLIFERSVPVPEKSETVRVEIGFRLEAEDKAKKSSECIVKVKDSPLVVYFPTEKETNLGFLIQGPYKTTPSRDNIPKDDVWNETLIRETAGLIVDTLFEVKSLGLLSVSFVETLPIKAEDFPDDSMFYPIFESVRKALIEEELLPASDGSFVSADNAKLARGGELRNLLDYDQLVLLFQSRVKIKWLSGEITQDRTPDLRNYLMTELDVEEVTPESFARKIDHSFLSALPDAWLIDFYGFLSGQEALWRAPRREADSGGILRLKPILRLEDDSQETPFKSNNITPNAFLPPPEATDFPVVKRLIADNEQAYAFLERLGLSKPDIFDDIVERVLPKYTESNENSVSDAENQADIRKIARAMHSDSESGKARVIVSASQAPFLKAINPTGEISFRKPNEIYLDTQELRRYFSNYTTVWFLHDENLLSEDEITILRAFGVSSLPRVIRLVHEGYHDLNIDNDLDGLKQALEKLSCLSSFEEKRTLSVLIWRILACVLQETPDLFLATYKWKYYRKWREKYTHSKAAKLLRETAWIQTKEGTFEKPGEITTDQIPDEFLEATELIEKLGIAEISIECEEENREYAKKLGISLEDVEIIKKNSDQFEQWKASMNTRKENPEFPSRPVPNSERRQEMLSEQLFDSPEKEYETRERSVRTTNIAIDPITWLRNQYTNEADQMVCQICKEEMPFRKRDGTHYFEKKEVLSRKFLPKENEAQYLALCPICAAKYEEFIRSDDNVMSKLKEAIVSAENYEVPISFGNEKTSIRFVETHYHDLRAIIDNSE
jgi:hypothetical protein